MRIPFDSLTLAAVAEDLHPFLNAKVQRVSQPDEYTVVLSLYASGAEGYLLVSCDPVFFRVHLATRRPENASPPPAFCAALRAKLNQARLRRIEQTGFDRILELTFEQPDAEYHLIAELMGKHSNVVLVDKSRRIAGVAKPIGISKSVRPLLIGRSYEPPPLPGRPSLLLASEGDELREFEGASPFLVKLLEAEGAGALERIQRVVRENTFSPILSPGNGAYPVPVRALQLPEFARPSISIALEQHFSTATAAYKTEQLRASLLSQLGRVLLARETAISELEQALDAAVRAASMQLKGELILAFGSHLPQGSKMLEATDYDGHPVAISLDPDLGYLENANRYFEKAKKAKSRRGLVEDQLKRLRDDADKLRGYLAKAATAERLQEVETLLEEARQHRWLQRQSVSKAGKEVRPYEGHRIRELIGPEGATVLFGENATSNDYLTARVAKPDDYWLHIRGSASAHVVIRTDRHPEKVGKELLMFAAKVAVQNSPSKHAGYVPVDYTLRKYVRKPHGSPPGTALYTHEKTLHVES